MKRKSFVFTSLFIGLLGIICIASIPYHVGIGIFDASHYVKCAVTLTSGCWPEKENLATHRPLSYLPYAAGIEMFGYGKWLTWITFMEFLVLLTLIYTCLKNRNRVVALLIVASLGLSRLMLQNSTMITSDILETLLVNYSVLVYLFYASLKDPSRAVSRISGVLVGLLWIAAFLVKESAVFYLPLLAYFAWQDRISRNSRLFWGHVIVTGVVAMLAMLVVYDIVTGTPWYRFRAIISGPLQDETFVQLHNTSFISDVINPFPFLVSDPTFFVLFLLSLVHFVQPSKNTNDQRVKQYLLLTLAVWWIGSIHVQGKSLLTLTYRYWIPLVVPLAMNAGYALNNLLIIQRENQTKRDKTIGTVLVTFLLLSGVSMLWVFQEYQSVGLIESSWMLPYYAWYVVIVISLLSACYILKTARQKVLILTIALVLPLVGNRSVIAYDWFFNRSSDAYDDEQEIIFSAKKDSCAPMVLCERALAQNYGVYDGFKGTSSAPFVGYSDANSDSLEKGTLLIFNGPRMYYNKNNISEVGIYANIKNQIPDFVLCPEQHGFRLVKENKTCQLFRLD